MRTFTEQQLISFRSQLFAGLATFIDFPLCVSTWRTGEKEI